MATEYTVYIGTYTKGDSEGIYVYQLDARVGKLTRRHIAPDRQNPSFLALHPAKPYLYAVNEIGDFGGERAGAVTAYAIDSDGGLARLNQVSTRLPGPCHLSVDASGRNVLVAIYGGGGVAVLPIAENGALNEASDCVRHSGRSVHPTRQTAPHAHSVQQGPPGPLEDLIFVPDLGVDRIMVYRLDTETGKLHPRQQESVAVSPGEGPRHMDFHRTLPFVYVVNELGSSVTVFRVDPEDGALSEVETVSTLPQGVDVKSTCADIHIHPLGDFLYASNRGHDSIAVFRIDPGSGRLTPVQHMSTMGETPRNFAVDPTGTLLLAANQDSDTVVSFSIDTNDGTLHPTGHVADVPMPVCIRLVPHETAD